VSKRNGAVCGSFGSPVRSQRGRGSRRVGLRRLGLGENVERTETQRLADTGWVESGGELIWVAGFTSGGAPFRLRVCDFSPADLEATGLDIAAAGDAGRATARRATARTSIEESEAWPRDDDVPF
jgi:hypothetical protein